MSEPTTRKPGENEGWVNLNRRLVHLRLLVRDTEKEIATLMSNIDSAVTDLTNAVQAVGTRVATDVKTLKDQLAAAIGQVPANMQQTIAAIEANVTALSAIDPANPPVPVPPVPPAPLP